MKRLLLLLFLPKLLLAQNLVVNPGFEDLGENYKFEPCRFTNSVEKLDEALPGWTTISRRTPDVVLHDGSADCMFPKPQGGRVCAGFINYFPAFDSGYDFDYHEYLQGTLTEPLRPGVTYEISFWLLQSDSVAVKHIWSLRRRRSPVLALASNNIGIYFLERSHLSTSYPKLSDFKPHFNIEEIVASPDGKWRKYTGTFTADKYYRAFLIGNFFTDEQTKINKPAEAAEVPAKAMKNGKFLPDRTKRIAYYCIDDVNIQKYDPDKIKPIIAIETDKPYTFQNVYFETGESELLPGAEEELAALADFIQSKPAQRFEIGGHTDDVGEAADNQLLSEQRARTVYEFLLQLGVNEAQLTYKGYGESLPIADNRTPEGRQQNRRVACTRIK